MVTCARARSTSLALLLEAAMDNPDFETFAADARAEGFDEVLERRWAPATVLQTHTHPFALKALVVQGEMWLTVDAEARHLRPGDSFALERNVPHAERYGPEGATYWVARRNAAETA
jgi:mannose-6-phosphate isomerase-like protein (cupin superfamily)